MALFTKLGNDVFAPTTASGAKRSVENIDAQRWSTEVERMLSSFQAGGGIIFPSKYAMDGTLNYHPNQMAWVLGDDTSANNGIYRKTGASGSGSWVRLGDLPFSFIQATNSGAGTPNAIVATTNLPLPSANGGALVSVNITVSNSGSPVTVSFNGDPALTIKTSSGNDVAIAGLVAGMVVAGYRDGLNFRLLSDQASAAIIAQVEAMKNETEAARDATLAALSSVISSKATVATAAADEPDVDPEYYDVAFFDTSYTAGSGAKYRKVVGEPTHQAKFQNGNGTWYALIEKSPRVEQFGGGTGNSGTDGVALEALIGYVDATGITGAEINIAAGTYRPSAGTLLPNLRNKWKMAGVTIDYSDVDNDDLIPLYGTTPNTFFAAKGIKSAIPDLDDNVVKGDYIMNIPNHGFAPGDHGEIYDPTDGSWTNARTYYRAGEPFRVLVVPDADTIWIDEPLWAGYDKNVVELSKWTPWSGDLEGPLHIIGNGSTARPTYGIGIDVAAQFSIKSVFATNVSYTGCTISNAFDFDVLGCGGADNLVTDFAGDYGLGLFSVHRYRVINSHFLAARHGITHGNVAGSFPNRDGYLRQCSAACNRDSSTGAEGFDIHGIAESILAEKCNFPDGIVSGCKGFTLRDSTVGNFPGYAYCFRVGEAKGGVTRLLDNEYAIGGTYVSGGENLGVFELGGGGPSSHANLTEDATYIIKGITVRDSTNANKLVRLGSANETYKTNLHVEDIDDDGADRGWIVQCNGFTGSPIAADFQTVRGIRRFKTGPGIMISHWAQGFAEPARYDFEPMSGTVEFSSGTGPSATQSVTFPWELPKAPTFAHAAISSPSTVNSAANYPDARAQSLSASSMTIVARTNAFNNFASDVTLTAHWQASLRKH